MLLGALVWWWREVVWKVNCQKFEIFSRAVAFYPVGAFTVAGGIMLPAPACTGKLEQWPSGSGWRGQRSRGWVDGDEYSMVGRAEKRLIGRKDTEWGRQRDYEASSGVIYLVLVERGLSKRQSVLYSSRRRIAGGSLIDSSELANQSCKPNQGSLLFYTSLRMRSSISSA